MHGNAKEEAFHHEVGILIRRFNKAVLKREFERERALWSEGNGLKTATISGGAPEHVHVMFCQLPTMKAQISADWTPRLWKRVTR